MKLGFLVDGRSEYGSLPILFEKLRGSCAHELLNPIYVDIQPKSTPRQIAAKCKTRVPILLQSDIHAVIVLIDLEDLADHPGERAEEIAREIEAQTQIETLVVLKVRCFENWVVADVDAVNRVKNLSISKTNESRIRPNKADNVNASKVISGKYHKVNSSKSVFQHANPLEMAQNSRSFRRFLRVVGHCAYSNQSRKAAQR